MNGTPLKLKKVKESPIIDMICSWNAKRYQQKYDYELTINLLNEEVLETQEAMEDNDWVEVVDGLGDVVFVAIGALWKQGFNTGNILAILDNVPHVLHSMPVPVAMHWFLFHDRTDILATIVITAFNTLCNFTTEKAAIDILTAICKSNNTKTATMTLPNVKANLDKGPNFVPPTQDIINILNSIGVLNGN